MSAHHRASLARTRVAERVRIVDGPITKETNLIRCTVCGEVVSIRVGVRDTWVHQPPAGTITPVFA